jgi:hypothetical protein
MGFRSQIFFPYVTNTGHSSGQCLNMGVGVLA